MSAYLGWGNGNISFSKGARVHWHQLAPITRPGTAPSIARNNALKLRRTTRGITKGLMKSQAKRSAALTGCEHKWLSLCPLK